MIVKLYFTEIGDQLGNECFAYFLNGLPPELCSQILKFKYWQDRQMTLYGKLLLKKLLDEYDVNSDLIELRRSAYGRPFLSDKFDFNISHSGDYVICAFCFGASIGIDIEEIKFINILDFKDQFDPVEWDEIITSPDQLSNFYHFWTLKEAAIKADGRGLGIPLNQVIVRDSVINVHNNTWHYKTLKLAENYAVNLVCDLEITEIIIRKIDFNCLSH